MADSSVAQLLEQFRAGLDSKGTPAQGRPDNVRVETSPPRETAGSAKPPVETIPTTTPQSVPAPEAKAEMKIKPDSDKTLRELCNEVLANLRDARHLDGKPKNNVFLLSETKRQIDTSKIMDGSMPLIWNGKVPTRVSIDKFRELAESAFAVFKDVDMTGVILTGNCVWKLLLGEQISGISVNFVGLTEEQARNKANEIAKAADKYYQSRNQGINIFRSEEDIAFNQSDGRFWVCVYLNLFRDMSELLAHIGVAFDGVNVYLSRAAKFTLDYGVDILDDQTTTLADGNPVLRQYNSGLAVAIPDLNMDLLRFNLKPGSSIAIGPIVIGGGFGCTAPTAIAPVKVSSGQKENVFTPWDVSSVSLQNAKGESGIRIYEHYRTKPIDVTTIDCKLSQKTMRDSMMWMHPASINYTKLVEVFGEHPARCVVQCIMAGQTAAQAIDTTFNTESKSKPTLEFRFLGATEGTLLWKDTPPTKLCGSPCRAVENDKIMTHAEFYGKYARA